MSVRTAQTVTGLSRPGDDDTAIFYSVGEQYPQKTRDGEWIVAGTVTRITVSDDMPGPHGLMERVRVFDGSTLIFEAPLHSLEGVFYEAPARA